MNKRPRLDRAVFPGPCIHYSSLQHGIWKLCVNQPHLFLSSRPTWLGLTLACGGKVSEARWCPPQCWRGLRGGESACLGSGWEGAQFLCFRVTLKFSSPIFLFAPSFFPSCVWGVSGSLSVHKLRQEVASPSGAGVGLRGLSGVETISTLTSFTPLK